MDFSVRRVEPDIQAANLEQRFLPCVWRGGRGPRSGRVARQAVGVPAHQRSFGSSASRRPSPTKLKAKSVAAMNSEGNTSIHGADSIWSAPWEMSTPQDVSGS